ncbi:MAG: DNA mismatch repair protein MutS [Bacteroidota bacterium]|nr:DNA mismatch repair protein MutS [Bacteroidota bacterium]
MKAFLMFEKTNFSMQQKLAWNEEALIQDLELNTLFNGMAQGDDFIFEVAKKAVLSGVYNDVNTILYRQNTLRDSLNNASIIKKMYKISVEAIKSNNKSYLSEFSLVYPTTTLQNAVGVMQLFVKFLQQLRTIADNHSDNFHSEGFTMLFAMLKKELDDEFFTRVKNHLQELKLENGILLSAELGKGNKGKHWILHRFKAKRECWFRRLFPKKSSSYTFSIYHKDDRGMRILSDLKGEGVNLVANALAQSADHIHSFFTMLQTELAFYMGCLNLHEQLTQMGEPTSFPSPLAKEQHKHSFEELYDACLALTLKQKTVGNTTNVDDKTLVLITGANKGGKTTYLRSIGLSQLMMQCGMFVPAETFEANLCDSLITHFKREEDITMKSGKLDEELSRMNDIINHLTPNSIVLFNESFAATNEREGSEIARQIVNALLEKRIRVYFVTHLYDFANSIYVRKLPNVISLRAVRQNDTSRTFRLEEAEPQETSYGEDLYDKIFLIN